MSEHNSDRIRRASKLIMLEWLVPLFVRKRTTDFFLPQIDPAWFTKLGIQWGVWRMSEPEFAVFEKKMLTVYADTLASVSPAFKDKVFARIDETMRMGATLSMAADTLPPQPPGEATCCEPARPAVATHRKTLPYCLPDRRGTRCNN